MAVPSNYIDKITKGNDSRMISPAADMVRVDNDNFDGTDLDGVLDEIAESISGAGGGTVKSVTVETPEDGTVDINVDDDTYTINLNHTHENMAKLVVCEESDLPSTLDNNTIYAITDSGETEIEKLIIRGMEFAGGGYDPGTPHLVNPTSSQISNGINIGNTTSGVATYSLHIKAKDLTQSLLVQWGSGSTGYSFNTSNLPTGVTYDSGTGKLTITKESACGINGVDIPVVYTGSDTDENAEGTIGISSSSVDGINVELPLIANKVAYEQLTAIKLTGTQWGQTDYNVVANTKVSMRLKFTENANTIAGNNSNKNYYFLTAYTLSSASKQFAFYVYKYSSTVSQLFAIVPTTPPTGIDIPQSSFLTDDSLFEVGLQSMKFIPNGGTAITKSIGATQAMDKGPLTIGLYHSSSGTDSIFNWYDLTIYELTITENDVVKRHYTPVAKNGVPGLLDSETGHFMSSKTSTEFVAIPLT